MPPDIMTKAMPTALMAVNETWRSRMMKLLGVAKFGAITANSPNHPKQHQQGDVFLEKRKGIAGSIALQRSCLHSCRTLLIS